MKNGKFSSLPKTLANALARFDRKNPGVIDEVANETGREFNGYWIYLTPGWINSALGCHMIHEWTVSDCISELKSIVKCDCEECEGSLRAK